MLVLDWNFVDVDWISIGYTWCLSVSLSVVGLVMLLHVLLFYQLVAVSPIKVKGNTKTTAMKE